MAESKQGEAVQKQQALEHLAAVILYLRSCGPAEAASGARRCLDLLSSWVQPPDCWQEPQLSLLDAKGYGTSGTVEEAGQVYGICPHHLVPYYGSYRLRFRPDAYLAGLSSISRAVDCFCRRALLQEVLTQELGEFFYLHLQPHAMEFSITARHFCKEMAAAGHSCGSQGFVTHWRRGNAL